MNTVFWVLRLVILAAFAAGLHYSLPSRDIVYILGTEVAQVQRQVTDAQGNRVNQGHDVRYIKAAYPDGSPRVYRNEDTDWSFPWYLKFDSANLDTRAATMTTVPPAEPVWVVVTHYGWRVPIMSWFPNAITMRLATGPNESLFPWFNIVFVSVLCLMLLILRRFVLILIRRHVDPVISAIDRGMDDTADAITAEARGWRAFARRLLG